MATATRIIRNTASTSGSPSPTREMTERLWSAFCSTSRTVTPGTSRPADAIAATFAASRPSEKFGTDSNRLTTPPPE